MLFSGEERFQESTSSLQSSSPDFMPQTSLLSTNGGAIMQDPWYQGNPSLDRHAPPSSSSRNISRKDSELDLIKPRQPAFAFSKAPKTHTLPTSPIQLPVPPQSESHPNPNCILQERSGSPVKHFGTGSRSQVRVPASNTPTISIAAVDRAFKVLLPTPTSHKFPVSDRKQKLAPSTTPGPGQYQPAPPPCRTTTLKSRTKMFGCAVGEDSPGPSSYSLPSSLLKKSHNVRSNGFGSENSGGAPNRPNKTDGQVSNAEATKVPCPPSRLNIKPSTQPPASSRNRNIFQASELIAESNNAENIILQEHFSKQHVKDSRNLFRNMMTRSSTIIEKSLKNDCDDSTAKPSNLINLADSVTDDTGAAASSADTRGEVRATTTTDDRATDTDGAKISQLYTVGQRILCNYCNHGQWCPGIISSTSASSSVSVSDGRHILYDIHYDDGDTEEGREEEAIREIPDESSSIVHFPFHVGDQVLGNYEEKGIWFEGVLSSFEVEGEDILFDIEYLDGDMDYSIAADCIIHAKKVE